MKKNLSAIIIACFILNGCSYYTTRSMTKPTTDLKKYGKIYVGWLDLGKEKWSLYGYQTEKEWLNLISRMNCSGIPSYFTEAFPDNMVIASKAEKDAPPKDCLYIKFTKVNFDYDHDTLSLSIHCIDGATGQELSKASVKLNATHGGGWGMFNFDNRILNAMRILSLYVKEKMII